ncbi:uncharacterized protein BO66DRAFT_210365 [Aspergillus aculeatinus CBS 121060]|uniref:Uncharacterized protein n=1 Tax=Aspergillus aculeatinus CBS 121060 TaxID=1448322 RepID=A0ACD1GVR5_9EURO|nr:hypothetical protein BO66DRAFT_210365 [Aspergillus aculeatinus CBS 121060]RAH65458.1 hypothetical protein BO66DRAFT_210365 [Aspergillus aculeatinus CBS 121060]
MQAYIIGDLKKARMRINPATKTVSMHGSIALGTSDRKGHRDVTLCGSRTVTERVGSTCSRSSKGRGVRLAEGSLGKRMPPGSEGPSTRPRGPEIQAWSPPLQSEPPKRRPQCVVPSPPGYFLSDPGMGTQTTSISYPRSLFLTSPGVIGPTKGRI